MGYVILALLATAGLVASIICHVIGWLAIDPWWGAYAFVLHFGALMLWFPLVLGAHRTKPTPWSNHVDQLSAVLPKWVRLVAAALFVYALLNFAFFIYSTNQYPRHGVPTFVELRGFSGYWMLFYGLSAAGFVALRRLARHRKQGHGVA